MAFRFDMKDRTKQQQIIVAKRDAEGKQKQQEIINNKVKNIPDDINTNLLILAIDKDTCPYQDNIIIKQQCSDCEYYKGFTLSNGLPCVKCLFKITLL